MPRAPNCQKTKRGKNAAHVISFLASDDDNEATRSQTSTHRYTEYEIRPSQRVSARNSLITAGDALEPQPCEDVPCEDPENEPLTNTIDNALEEFDDEGYLRDFLETGQNIPDRIRVSVSVTDLVSADLN